MGQGVREITDIAGQVEKEAVLTYESPISLPVPVEASVGCFGLELSGNMLKLTVPLYEGELKHFYADYQNYFYLIYEDNAIHKSVGQYVEKEAKKKATAKTCYTRVSGLFLPQPGPIWDVFLKCEYKDKQTYVPYTEELFQEPSQAVRYLKEVLSGRKF